MNESSLMITSSSPTVAAVVVQSTPTTPDEQPNAASREKVMRWREQATRRNQWRKDSLKAVEYADGNQFDYELKEKYKEADLPLLYENCIRRWVSTTVGQQAQNLTDGIVRVEDNRYEHFADAMSAKLKEAERMSRTDNVCVRAWDSAVKAGIGWIEVGDPIDAFQYPHRVELLPWREMWWDMSDRTPGLNYAEWFRRIKFVRRNDARMAFPGFDDIIAGAGSQSDLPWDEIERYERQELWQRDSSQWSQPDDPDIIAVNEFRYRVWVNGYVMDTPMGVQLFDEKNPQHMALYQNGVVTPRVARYRRVRRAYWIGPHCVEDDWLDLANNEIGWIPIVYAIEERTGVPYGMVRDMIALQDEINTRKAKAAVSIDSATLIGDHDRVKDWNQARKAVNRRRGVIMLDGQKPNGRFEIDRHQGVTAENLQMYESAKASIGYIHGLDAPFAGTPSTPGQSGVALNGLIQQSQQALGLPVSNFVEGRYRVLTLLLDRITKDMGDQPTQIRYKRKSDGAFRTVMVNVPVQLDDGSVEVLSPMTVRRTLILEETPSTSTYRHQQFMTIVDTLRALPPEAQSMLLPAMFELSDLPNRQMYADMARKQLGLGEPKNEQEAQAAQAEQQKKDAADQLAQMAMQVKVAREKAEADLKTAQAAKVQVEASRTQAQVTLTQAEVAKKQAETQAIEQDMHDQAAALAAGPPGKQVATYRW